MSWFWPFKHSEAPLVSESSSSWIRGISNDTLFIFFFVVFLIALWIHYTRRERNTDIHPENQQDVELLRQRSEQHGDSASARASSSRPGRSRQDTCPICLNEPSVLSVETNCGHLFCGKCIIEFWKFQSNWMSGMKCPVCRQQVTVLLTRFTADEQASSRNPDRQLVINGVKDFNQRFSGAPRTYGEYVQDIPVLIPHIIRQIFTMDGLAWTRRLRILLIFLTVIVYVVSPFDILPESVLGLFGLLDDLLVVLYGALQVIVVFRQAVSGE